MSISFGYGVSALLAVSAKLRQPTGQKLCKVRMQKCFFNGADLRKVWYHQFWIQKSSLCFRDKPSDARYFIVKVKCHYDFIIVLWANSYFKCITQKSLKRGIVGLCKSYFENMRADFVLRYQKLTSQSTP